jgi:hypothetical protein
MQKLIVPGSCIFINELVRRVLFCPLDTPHARLEICLVELIVILRLFIDLSAVF